PLTGTTVADNTATGGTGGDATASSGGGAGGEGSGGGAAITDFRDIMTTIVNSTISGNTATGGVGGAGIMTGTQARALGGGLFVFSGFGGSATLASVTLANNSASGSATSTHGGNLDRLDGGLVLADTIIAGGSATASGSNCDLTGFVPTDNGHNLEDTTPSQCGLSAAKADLIGASAALLPLASNGGPTQTRALGPASQGLGTGGPCTDPSQTT